MPLELVHSIDTTAAFIVNPDPGDGLGEYVEIPLTRGYVAWVSPHRAAALSVAGAWVALVRPHTTYATRIVRRPDGSRTTEYMHRLILQAPAGLQVDHSNRNGLDNRDANLRLVTQAQNKQNASGPQRNNKSGYRGVAALRSNGTHQALLGHVYLGTFRSPQAAALAADAARIRFYGAFAGVLNVDRKPSLIEWADAHDVLVDGLLRERVEMAQLADDEDDLAA